MPRLWFGVGKFLDHQVFRATELLDDDCTHAGILRIDFAIGHRLKVLSGLRVAGRQTACPIEENADSRRYIRAGRFQREVTRVEEADIGTRDIALERFGPRGQEERVVLVLRPGFWRLRLPHVRQLLPLSGGRHTTPACDERRWTSRRFARRPSIASGPEPPRTRAARQAR